MARIRSPQQPDPLIANRPLIDELVEVLKGRDSPDGPVVFEVTVGNTERLQIIIIWERWQDLSAEVRTRIVTAAYEAFNEEHPGEIDPDMIAMILPMTAEQAIEMRVLPYSVQCNVHRTQANYSEIASLLRAQGAIDTQGGIELRLPTLEMAKAARDRLREATKHLQPEVRWQIAEDVGRIYDYG